LYVASNTFGVYKSTNGGDLWVKLFQKPGKRFTSIIIDPKISETIYAVVNNEEVYKSTDGGLTWKPFNKGFPGEISIRVLLFDPITPKILYAGSDKGIYKSSNSGNWISIGKPAQIVNTLSVALSTSPILYAGTSNGVYSLQYSPLP
jgi:hypothetical protein